MFNEPNEEPVENAVRPEDRAREKADEFRVHAELAAAFEGPRKFDAALRPLDGALAREIQQTIGRLEKSKSPDSPVLPPPSMPEAGHLLNLAQTRDLPTNDYHVHHRPGEAMIVRWLQGDQVDAFYNRLQAHFDAAITGYREEERHTHQWKQDPKMLAYLEALDAVDIKMEERYLREPIRQHGLYVLSTLAADELNIAYLCDYIMSVPAEDLVGRASAPPEEPTEKDLAWFFKLFSLRGMHEGTEQMCFFAYLQKTDDGGW